MSFFRYYKETKDADGEALWWPGGPAGYPFRGYTPPTTTDNEYQNLRVTVKTRTKLFYLSKEEDLKSYNIIRDKCSNGLYILLDRDRTWDEETKHYKIYLEWAEPAYDLPPPQLGVKDAILEHTKNTTSLPYNRLAGFKQTGW